MRNPRILNFYILFLIFNLNLIIQIIPSTSYESEVKLNSNNSDSWGRIINPNHNIYYPTMRFINDNIYIAGIIDKGNYDYAIYLTKYNISGIKLWENIWNSPYDDFLSGCEVDSDENLYLLCQTEYTDRVYLIKYSNSGELLWDRILVEADYCKTFSISLDLDDSIYVSGWGTNSSINYKILMKLNSSGSVIWHHNLNFWLKEIQIDSKNNIYGCGAMGSIYFIDKYNSSGIKLWSKELGAIGYVTSMDFDTNENFILTGYKYNSSNYSYARWILKYNNSVIFMNKLELLSLNYFSQCRIWFIRDNFYIFIDYPNTPNSCFLKYNATFHLKWNVSLNKYYVTPYFNLINIAIGIDSHENIIILYNNPRGNYTSEISKEKYNAEDISVLILNSSGEILSHYYWGGSYHDEPIQILIDPLNNMYLLCSCSYVDIWNMHINRIILVKNPEINGTPPQLQLFGGNDYYIFSLMGVMSVISIILLVSIIRPKLRRFLKNKKSDSPL